MKLNLVILPLVAALVAAMLQGTEARMYMVGEDLRWTVPPGGATTYASWVASYPTFKVVEDSLSNAFIFDFKAGEHDLTIVTKENFDSCNTNNPLYQFKIPYVVVTPTIPGTLYFTCSSAEHCNMGQKVAIQFESSLSGVPNAALSSSPSAEDATVQLKITTFVK